MDVLEVAICEDSPEERERLLALIEKADASAHCTTFTDGESFLGEFRPGKYDLIFMDIQMPIMNGYEATAAIRSLPGGRGKVPIIAMTANAFAEDVQLAKNTGMNEHIAKPLELDKLNDVLKQWLQ